MPTPRAARAIIFVVDGLRPDALPQAATPRIDRLAAQGAYTWQAQSVSPTITLPCHASLFLAVPLARPTLAHLLGLTAPVEWQGQAVEEALAA